MKTNIYRWLGEGRTKVIRMRGTEYYFTKGIMLDFQIGIPNGNRNTIKYYGKKEQK